MRDAAASFLFPLDGSERQALSPPNLQWSKNATVHCLRRESRKQGKKHLSYRRLAEPAAPDLQTHEALAV
jgi:hypothetical protein